MALFLLAALLRLILRHQSDDDAKWWWCPIWSNISFFCVDDFISGHRARKFLIQTRPAWQLRFLVVPFLRDDGRVAAHSSEFHAIIGPDEWCDLPARKYGNRLCDRNSMIRERERESWCLEGTSCQCGGFSHFTWWKFSHVAIYMVWIFTTD